MLRHCDTCNTDREVLAPKGIDGFRFSCGHKLPALTAEEQASVIYPTDYSRYVWPESSGYVGTKPVSYRRRFFDPEPTVATDDSGCVKVGDE